MCWDGRFSLMQDAEGNTGFRTVSADDILYFCIQQNQVIAHTLEDELFTGWSSLDLLWRAIKATDSRFYRTDRAFIANMSRATVFDREWCKLYFGEISNVKHCYVARSKQQEVEIRLQPGRNAESSAACSRP